MTKLQNDILKILCEDARTTAETISVMLNQSKENITKEIEKLEQSKTIVKYTAVVNTEKLDYELVEAMIEVKVSPSFSRGFDSIAQEIYKFEEVKSLYLMSGGYDLCVVVAGKTLKEVALFVSEKLSTLDKVIATATHFILKKYKSEGVLMASSGCEKRIAVHV